MKLISTSERDNAMHSLQKAFLDGYINEHELGERLDKALKVRNIKELDSIFVDLPIKTKLIAGENNITAILGGIEKRGELIQAENSRVLAVLGGCHLDLSSASFIAPVTTITITAILGGVEIIVPHNMRVIVRQKPILGGISVKVAQDNLATDVPLLYINACAVLGGIEIRSSKQQLII
jgi:hypothetical protein